MGFRFRFWGLGLRALIRALGLELQAHLHWGWGFAAWGLGPSVQGAATQKTSKLTIKCKFLGRESTLLPMLLLTGNKKTQAFTNRRFNVWGSRCGL